MNSQNLKSLADAFIEELKIKAYGEPADNEMEGDFGTWSDWSDALVEFAERLRADRSSELESSTGWSASYWLGNCDAILRGLENIDTVLQSAALKREIDTLSDLRVRLIEKLL